MINPLHMSEMIVVVEELLDQPHVLNLLSLLRNFI